MAGEREAAAAIFAVMADREPIAFTMVGHIVPPVFAIRHEREAPTFGDGQTLRRIAYEFQQSDLPRRPSKQDTFRHRGTLWRVANVTTLDDVFAWDVDVTDGGTA